MPPLLLAGLPSLVATWGALATTTGWPARLPLHLALLLLAGAAWAGALAGLKRIAPARSDRAVVLALALALRLPAWLLPPAHSDDVYRYAWDGRVARAGENPYRYSPDAPELAGLRDGSGPAAIHPRINHRELPTIYPPGAQLLFGAAAWLPLPPVRSLKLLLALCDLALAALLYRWLARRGDDGRWAAAWAWSPLAVIELSQNGHLDALPILGLVAALSSWEAGRRAAAGAWLGLSVATKGVALPLLVGLRSPRALLAALLVVLLSALPYLGAGPALLGSSGEFARRWRGNDGAFALLQAGADRVACRGIERWRSSAPTTAAPVGAACGGPLDLAARPALAAAITGRPERATVFPDELAGLLARAAVVLLLALLALVMLLSAAPPLAAAEWLLGAMLLLSPALKPWYALWVLPLAAVRRRAAWVALAALVPLGYLPLGAYLAGAPWRDPAWSRALEHGVVWALLLAAALVPRTATAAALDP